ncbi:antA/AntB antirepressor family protein [Flammeovirga pacifica]|uniref:AntA/AntB antirepressor domain-containing protein n=1 Tax=Flammeovirga pacifica TaxID=915059 RepID=A0A1S1Z0L5_FLAPC|nr:antA/AntB antirepressor family protein [Flammeovirga pacifica]OHX66723.1 hypothetical protein NH26_10320 [Flammeovirga pacifica]
MELIKIQEKEGKKLVNARDLYSFLGVKAEFTTWIKRMLDYGFTENHDYSSFDKIVKREKGATTLKEYAITLDMAKEISMIQRSEKGRKARRYFIECEKKLNNKFAIPQTLKEALLLAYKQEERIEQLKAKEKVADRLLSSSIAVSLGEFTKCYCDELHNIGQNQLFKLLRSRKHLINCKDSLKHNTPYQKYIDSGYYQVIQRPYKKGDEDSYSLQTLITPKGQNWILKNLDNLLEANRQGCKFSKKNNR